jgi:hypothetical protein
MNVVPQLTSDSSYEEASSERSSRSSSPDELVPTLRPRPDMHAAATSTRYCICPLALYSIIRQFCPQLFASFVLNCQPVLHTYHSRLIPEGVAERGVEGISDILSRRPRFTKMTAMKTTADVTGAILLFCPGHHTRYPPVLSLIIRKFCTQLSARRCTYATLIDPNFVLNILSRFILN